MNPFQSLRRLLLLASVAGVSWSGCGPVERDTEKASSSGSVSKTEAPPPAPKDVPATIKDLQAKLQPSGVPQPPAPPDEKTLRARAEELGSAFVAALQKGDREAAQKFVFSSKDFEEAVTPGHRSILESNISAQNDVVVQRLAESLKGKQVKVVWKPGELATGAKAVFQKAVPVLSNAALEIDADGVPVMIRLDQMVYWNNGWKVFRLSLP